MRRQNLSLNLSFGIKFLQTLIIRWCGIKLDPDPSSKGLNLYILLDKVYVIYYQELTTTAFLHRFNEEMIETLFGYNNSTEKAKVERKRDTTSDPAGQYVQLLDPKKSQNLSILLRALNVTVEEVCDALTEGSVTHGYLYIYNFVASVIWDGSLCGGLLALVLLLIQN